MMISINRINPAKIARNLFDELDDGAVVPLDDHAAIVDDDAPFTLTIH